MKTTTIRKWAGFMAAACLVLTLAACDQDVTLNIDHSVNLVQPGPKWPNKKKLKPTELEVYTKYGIPDHFRLLWNAQGTVQARVDLEKELKIRKPKDLPPHTWIYLKDNREVFFEGRSYREHPISDQTLILIKYGDPEDIKDAPGGGKQWMFFGAGKLYKFTPDGKIYEQKDFPAMGKYIKS